MSVFCNRTSVNVKAGAAEVPLRLQVLSMIDACTPWHQWTAYTVVALDRGVRSSSAMGIRRRRGGVLRVMEFVMMKLEDVRFEVCILFYFRLYSLF